MWKGGVGEGVEEEEDVQPPPSPDLSTLDEPEIATSTPLESKTGYLDDLHRQLCSKVSLANTIKLFLMNLVTMKTVSGSMLL